MIRNYLQERTSIVPVFQVASQAAAHAGSSVNSTAVDSTAAPFVEDGLFVAILGAPTGTPTGTVVIYQLQDASAGGSDWANVAGVSGTFGTTSTNPTALTKIEVPFSTAGIRPQRRWNMDVAFTSGTSPALPVTAFEILGRGKKEPLA